ncbi:MAG: long-chain-fatty-acid--CoA ligase [Phycisphaerales bacterium]|nr:MAG: long-chain-fatty-acid--CoA ligase [Phycisphaerales bacterium]
MSVAWALLRSLLRHPRRELVVDDRGAYSGLKLLAASQYLAGHIERRCATETVGLLLPTSAAMPIAALAGWTLGRTVVPLNYLLQRDELQYVIDHCGTDTLLTVGPMLEHLGYTPRCDNIVRLEDVPFRGAPDLRWPVHADGQDLAVLLYTSGTSGRPKGVMLTHDNLLSNVRQVDRFVHFARQRHTFLGVLPQFHSFGLTVMTLLPLLLGQKVVYSARFVPQQIVRLIRQHRPTVFVAIPSMYGALLTVKNASAQDFASLRYAVSGGEPLPEDVLKRFADRFGVTIHEGYGLTETSPVTHWCRPSEFKPGCVGQPLPGVEQRIVDLDSGQPVGPGRQGEVRLRGPNIMKGYYKDPAETARAFDELGFFRTGDIGEVDELGRLSITGRLKEMMIVGGENVFPREIEEVLNAHPEVFASGVTSRTSPTRGEEIIAFVQPEEGWHPDPAQLRTWCRQRLAGYKVPREVRIIDQLPRNPTGKILRRQLKAMLVREQQAGDDQAGKPGTT